MQFTADGIICAVRRHGETGVIVRLLTAEHGLIAGYVRGGRSRVSRPILLPGNLVSARFSTRQPGQLASLTPELRHSRAPLMSEPLAAAAVEWICASTAAALPEEQQDPALYTALTALLDIVELAGAARRWASSLARYELLLLEAAGEPLSLCACAVTGDTADLAYVSPKSGAAVSRAAAGGHEHRLLPLPPFLYRDDVPDGDQIAQGLRLTGYFVRRRLFNERHDAMLGARERLMARLEQALM